MNPIQEERLERPSEQLEIAEPEAPLDIDQFNADYLEDLKDIERSESDVAYVRVDLGKFRSKSRTSSVQKRSADGRSTDSAALAALAGLAAIPAATAETKALSEDMVGIIVAFSVFTFTMVLSFCKQNLEDYGKEMAWPIGFAGFGYFVVMSTHHLLRKPQQIESYATVFFIAIVAESLGSYDDLKEAGLSSSFWAIIVGIFFRNALGMNPQLGLSGEYFIKIGITLLAMDFSSMSSAGPGLVVAWLDTIIVFFVGWGIASYIFQLDLRSSIVVSGATCICGSSAATAIAGSVHSKSDFERERTKDTTQTIIALMSMLNTPLMPLLPLLYTQYNMNPSVVGAWIGGSIDSTGQVIASASLGSSDAMLETATIIKIKWCKTSSLGLSVLALLCTFRKR